MPKITPCPRCGKAMRRFYRTWICDPCGAIVNPLPEAPSRQFGKFREKSRTRSSEAKP